ncbi:MAG TPA: septum formation initiator family protein [Patescibacteria group bacterium]|nr:septum formation initiator family protein [Patescibacteria group bacterium]
MKRIFNKLGGYAIWLLILLLTVSVIKSIKRTAQIHVQIESEKAKLAKIQADNNKLSAELAQTQNPNFIERQVRDKLGLGKINEAIVVLPDAETLRKLAPYMEVVADTLPDPNWKKWEKLFF